MIIRLLEHRDEEPKVLDEIEVEGVDPLRVAPIHEQVGNLIPIRQLSEMLREIQPVETMNPEEFDSYYAQNISVWRDGDTSPVRIEIPHHMGLRIALMSILHKYGLSDQLLIQIS
jgi:hypothetical protein